MPVRVSSKPSRVLDLNKRPKERTVRIPFQVSEDEKLRFARLAKAKHTNLSELIRQMLHAEADKIEKGKAA